jgi:hypothetical protein
MNEALTVIEQYPESVQKKLMHLRALIFEVAQAQGIQDLEETLKWGEPSYVCKHGSTLRFDWKASKPDEYAMYFNCKTRLIETIREFYGQELNIKGNREISFKLDEALPEAVVKHCIQLSLSYHKIKHLPTLGV